jgi:hypothetical protein
MWSKQSCRTFITGMSSQSLSSRKVSTNVPDVWTRAPPSTLDQPFIYLQRNRAHVTKVKGLLHIHIQNRAVIAMHAEGHVVSIGEGKVAGPVLVDIAQFVQNRQRIGRDRPPKAGVGVSLPSQGAEYPSAACPPFHPTRPSLCIAETPSHGTCSWTSPSRRGRRPDCRPRIACCGRIPL